jgi:hypothetical protein
VGRVGEFSGGFEFLALRPKRRQRLIDPSMRENLKNLVAVLDWNQPPSPALLDIASRRKVTDDAEGVRIETEADRDVRAVFEAQLDV